jgi:hypothetical protein
MADTVKRQPGCTCHQEIGDSRCNVHPTCDYCGAPLTRARMGILGFRGRVTGRYCTAEHRHEAEGEPVREPLTDITGCDV